MDIPLGQVNMDFDLICDPPTCVSSSIVNIAYGRYGKVEKCTGKGEDRAEKREN